MDTVGFNEGRLTFSIEGLSATQGLGFGRLQIRLKVGGHADEKAHPIRILDLGGNVEVTFAEAGHYTLGTIEPYGGLGAIGSNLSDFNHSLTTIIEVDPARFSAIENRRNGGTFEISLSLHVRTLGAGAPQGYVNLSRKVLQSEWAALGEQMGFGKTVLIEIPVGSPGPAQQNVLNSVKKIQAKMLRGEWSDAVGEARFALDALAEGLGDDKDDPAHKSLMEKTRKLDKAGRLRFIRDALRAFTNLAHHPGELPTRDSYDRVDAQLGLALLAALLARYPLPEHPAAAREDVAGKAGE